MVQLLPDIVSVLSLGDDQSPSVTRLALLLVSELFKEVLKMEPVTLKRDLLGPKPSSQCLLSNFAGE